MALGSVTMKVVPGGGQQAVSAASLARTIVFLGVATGGEVNQVYQPATQSALVASLGKGPLVEALALAQRAGLSHYAVPVLPSAPGALSASVTHAGTGAGTVTPSLAPHQLVEVKITTAGALGAMAFSWRVGGVGAFSAPVVSAASPGNTFRVPGTFCTLTFAAGTYVLNSTYTVGLDGVVTVGGSGISTVTQASSPTDDYEVIASVVSGGALGAATLRVSVDNGNSTLPDMAIPSSGKVIIPGTGIVLTCASTFVAGDSYSFLAAAPGYSTSDLQAAIAAVKADQSVAAELIYPVGMPSSAASAVSQAASLDSLMQTAFSADELDWQALCDCPSAGGDGSIIVSGGNAVRDTADTDTVVRTARSGQDLTRTAMACASHRMTSPISGFKQLRPFGWALASRFVDTDPRDDLSATEPLGKLGIYAVGRDEYAVATPLDDVQINVARTYRGRAGAYLAITSGGFGFKNLTTQATYQDAGSMRALNVALAKLRVVGQGLLGQRPKTNADGTIHENAARDYDVLLDSAIKKALGLVTGGDFVLPQVSLASARVSRGSQLGASPHRLDIEYSIQTLGFISDVSGVVQYSGVITVEA